MCVCKCLTVRVYVHTNYDPKLRKFFGHCTFKHLQFVVHIPFQVFKFFSDVAQCRVHSVHYTPSFVSEWHNMLCVYALPTVHHIFLWFGKSIFGCKIWGSLCKYRIRASLSHRRTFASASSVIYVDVCMWDTFILFCVIIYTSFYTLF